ncbi:MAG: FAD binding domain-containing protein [Deltaproteobacteria bacterium]|nr:FAD binding domain-containing protein [Deltaproteobacteria bacterium]
MLTCDQYLRPATLHEAFALMAEHAGRHKLIGGGTDLLPWAREGRAGAVHFHALIDVSRIPELGGIALTGGRLRIGAMTPFARCLDHPLLLRHAPLLARCAVWFADDQIRESATLGGNLVNASPAADAPPALMAMNTEVILARGQANGPMLTRRVRVEDFAVGPGKTVLQPGELVLALECDDLAGYGADFEKVGHRRSLVISTVCVAALVKLDRRGSVFEDVRLGLAAVGPVPVRLTECETHLRHQPVSADRIDGIAELPMARVLSRTRQEYRRHVLGRFVVRAIRGALAHAQRQHAAGVPFKEAGNG